MMALPSSVLEILKWIDENSGMMPFFAALFYPIGAAVIGFAFHIIFKIIHVKLPEKVFAMLMMHSGLLWIIGFISQIILAFLDLDGLNVFAIWLATALVIGVFCIHYRDLLYEFALEKEHNGKKSIGGIDIKGF